MTYCRKCGAELPKDANFCSVCGTRVVPEGKPVEKHQVFKVTGKPKVTVVNLAPGSVKAKAGPEGEVTIDLDLKVPENLDCSVSQEDNVVTVNCRGRTGFWGWSSYVFGSGPSADILIYVPQESDLDLENRVGDVAVSGVNGNVVTESSAGMVRISDSKGTVRARTRAGSIYIENVDGTVSARSSAGAIRFSGSLAKGENWFRTNVGSVDLLLQGQPDLMVEASTRLGSITSIPELVSANRRHNQYTGLIGAGTGRLIVETKTGSITIHHQS